VASLDRIRTDGFRRWYERQLIECHAWLVSWFLGVIVFVSGLELSGAGAATRVSGIALLLAGVLVAVYSWRRYRAMLVTAERLGEQASCPSCSAYGRFKVLSSWPASLPDGGDPSVENAGSGLWLRAKCRKCGGEWLIR
jgi:hypothetical protein